MPQLNEPQRVSRLAVCIDVHDNPTIELLAIQRTFCRPLRNSAISQPIRHERFPIVGVVASAGGLDAFKRLLSAVPTDCGLAFVLVPHLDPDYESQMVPLLSRISPIPVIKAAQGMPVERNHVYVIPSNNFMTIEDGLLQLCPPPTPQGNETAIDNFLHSLAVDQGANAIGIVLSGTGTHGTLGIREIKRLGGMAIAQDPASAEFDTMPTSIIQEGLADFVLPPGEMAATLETHVQSPAPPSPESRLPADLSESDQVSTIMALLHQQTRHDFSSYRKNMLLRRIRRRMSLHHLNDLQSYVAKLTSDPQEPLALYRDLLISVTAFFRDPEAYLLLNDLIANEIATRDEAQFPYRIWVAACASGEEAYSIAMLALESLDARFGITSPAPGRHKMVYVFASDVDESAIEIARNGLYLQTIAENISPERLGRHFETTNDGHYRIGKRLRDSVIFSKQNLLIDPPFSKIDLIACRNLMIYLEPEIQQRVLSVFHFALKDHGLLFLGPSESATQADQLFEPISKKWRIFKKLGSRQRRPPIQPHIVESVTQSAGESRTSPLPPRQGYKSLVEQSLLSLYAPATALINRRYEVLYVTGPLVDYLEFPAGEPSHNLLTMCRPGLRTKLRFACQKSVAESTDTEIYSEMKRGDKTNDCRIQVRVIKASKETEILLLVSFTDETHRNAQPTTNSSEVTVEKSSSYADQLEKELKSNSDELGGVIQDLEGANEDLKSSNEEIMSMNEELQSANEELETSKEELQSLNEELSTVNLELVSKVTELDVANNDILNLLSSTEISTLFLDNNLAIQRFTPPTVKLLNVRASDIGRPLSDITTRIIDHSLISDCREVIKNAGPIQSEIESEDSRMYLRRILPYRSSAGQVVGVVVTFIDLTDRLLLEKSLKQSKDHLEAILDSAVDAIITVDNQGFIKRINPATERLFGYSREDILGRPVMSLLTCPDGIQLTTSPVAGNLPMSFFGTGNYLELKPDRKNGTRFDAELTVSRIDHLELFIVVIRDVSQRKNLQKRILEIASDEQRRIGQELHDGTQQEITGLSLIAGAIKEHLDGKVSETIDTNGPVVLESDELNRLMVNATKLVNGLNEANRHVQTLSHGIMPVQIDAEGLHSALTELACETSVEGKVTCNFVHSGSLANQSNDVATHLYRIVQEAINNALRHGAAKSICISLSADDSQIQLEVSDDGSGLNDSTINYSGGIKRGAGLQIMEYRANVIGGKLTILAGKNNGTIVRCTLPGERQRP